MNNTRLVLLLCSVFLAHHVGLAQGAVSYKIVGENIYASISLKQTNRQLDSIAKSFGFSSRIALESEQSSIGWRFVDKTEDYITLALNKNQETKELPHSFMISDAEVIHLEAPPFANYGINSFKKRTVFTKNGKTTFKLDGFKNAKEVYLSGSFNDWSTLKTPMQKTENGWEITLELAPGKYLYKYIIDGRWQHDKDNRQKEKDGNNGFNSIYFVYNYIFSLNGFQNKDNVRVAGSFCNWQQLPMVKKAKRNKWVLAMYLREGTHAYKFVVDGDWITDPNNAVKREDGMGNVNSFTSVGDTLHFKLNGFHNAEKVFVAGSFNAWNFAELEMIRTFKGWQLPYVLAPGNYPYKFKVDEFYVVDPSNPIETGEGEFKSSILVVEANHSFILRGYGDANSVRLAGSFNGWNEHGYTMVREDGAWRISIHLPKGKHTYKFIVDGKWIADPENSLWERNEYDSKNSVLWIDAYSASINQSSN